MLKNSKRSVALKLDFKISAGKLRIIDLGDGLAADPTGFEDKAVSAQISQDRYEINREPVATVFGELPYDAMQSKTLHIPLVLRSVTADESYINVKDLSTRTEGILPYCGCGRIQSYVAYAWSKMLKNVASPPISLVAMEMHKVLWYILMEQHLRAEDYEPFLYWTNDNSPDIDLSSINIKNGVFIKIVDRSTGGGNEVYYARDKAQVRKTLNNLSEQYTLSEEPYKKHLFIIEPAYITLKPYKEKDYNVTGRAFVTLAFDPEKRALEVKIAAAKWMFPNNSLQENKTTDQMLSNIKHSIAMSSLSSEDLSVLSKGIIDCYGEVFKTAFEHDDMLEYCKEHPAGKSFLSCLRPNSSYKVQLDVFNRPYDEAQTKQLLINQINILIVRDITDDLTNLFNHSNQTSFKNISLEDLIKNICRLSFYERYLPFASTSKQFFSIVAPHLVKFLEKGPSVTQQLNALIATYLKQKDSLYDTADFNRALRQAADSCDLIVLKLLIYTYRAEINACSPKTKQTALDFAIKSQVNTTVKMQCLEVLKSAGAKTAEELKRDNLGKGNDTPQFNLEDIDNGMCLTM